jgi:hypothetical protein
MQQTDDVVAIVWPANSKQWNNYRYSSLARCDAANATTICLKEGTRVQ